MRAWVYALSGLLIWSVHFLGVYAIASFGDVVSRAEDLPFRMAGLVFSGLCFVGAGVVGWVAFRRARRVEGEGAFLDQIAAMGAGVAMIAIAWQALPTVVGY